jgi:hypothetical protein
MKRPELRTDGVLTGAWLGRTLALPQGASLMELDLQKLRTRLLAEQQVLSATLTKNFPDRLVVQISERSPIARLKVRTLGQEYVLLVARDGVIYAGEGYDKSVLETLPWLDGVQLKPDHGGFRPIPGMAVAAELLSRARIEAEDLYSKWFVISLTRLSADHKIQITTKEEDGGWTIYFSTNDDFFRQLAKLNYITDTLTARAPGAKATIDLTLGQDVPVTITPEAPDHGVPATSSTPAQMTNVTPSSVATAALRFEFARSVDAASEQDLFVLPSSPFKKTKREL